LLLLPASRLLFCCTAPEERGLEGETGPKTPGIPIPIPVLYIERKANKNSPRTTKLHCSRRRIKIISIVVAAAAAPLAHVVVVAVAVVVAIRHGAEIQKEEGSW